MFKVAQAGRDIRVLPAPEHHHASVTLPGSDTQLGNRAQCDVRVTACVALRLAAAAASVAVTVTVMLSLRRNSNGPAGGLNCSS